MKHYRFSRFIIVAAILFLICMLIQDKIVLTAYAMEDSCQKAIRINREIAPDMRRFIGAIGLPASEERNREMTRFIMSGAALKFYNEFCPALIDCGGLPGFPTSTTDVIIDICKKGMKK